MITIVVSPLGGSGVTITSILAALWQRELGGHVRWVELASEQNDSPISQLPQLPRLDVVRACAEVPSSEHSSTERRFLAAWLRAQRTLEILDPSVRTFLDLSNNLASWAWPEIKTWAIDQPTAVEILLILPPSMRSIRCIDNMPSQIAKSLILARPIWSLGSWHSLLNAPSWSRLIAAGARQLVLPSLSWGTTSDAMAQGRIPIGKLAAASFVGRMQLRKGLTLFGQSLGCVWPANKSDAAEEYSHFCATMPCHANQNPSRDASGAGGLHML